LADIQRLRFSGGTDHGMKRFILRNCMHAEGAVRQPDQFVITHTVSLMNEEIFYFLILPS